MYKYPKVFIIILNWNKLEDTLECLRSVMTIDYPEYEVIVVDNGSCDKQAKKILSKYSRVIIIENEENLGFSGGNNIGIRYAINRGADYLWLLNNDTIVERNCLGKLVELAESSEVIGLVSPMIYFFDDNNKVQFSGAYIDWKSFHIIYPKESNKNNPEFQQGKNVCLWGTALLIKKSVVERVGYLKEEYFAYWEDIEYSLRALNKNFENRVCTSAIVFHKKPIDGLFSNKQSREFFYFMARNRILLCNDYAKNLRQLLNFWTKFLGDLLIYIGICSRNSSQDKLEAFLDGTWHGLKSIAGPMKNEKGMPVFLKKTFILLAKWHPFLVRNIISFDFKEIYQKIKRKKIF